MGGHACQVCAPGTSPIIAEVSEDTEQECQDRIIVVLRALRALGVIALLPGARTHPRPTLAGLG